MASDVATMPNTIVPSRGLINEASIVATMPTSGGTRAISEAQGHDLGPAVVAGDEELRVLPEQVEQRLGDGQTAETQDDERPGAQLGGHGVAS